MKVVSIASVCETLSAGEQTKRASGNVEDFQKFFRPETLERLDRTHAGIFAFLVFHPVSDVHVSAYLREGTLSSDVGADLFVMFTSEKAARFPKNATDALTIEGVVVDDDEHASYRLARMVFPAKAIEGFPGIVFFPRLTGLVEPVYVHLPDKKVRERLQQLSGLCTETLRRMSGSTSFGDAFAPMLARERFQYVRGSVTSTSEWLYKALNFLRPYKKDIVTSALKVASAGVLGKQAEAAEDDASE